MRYWMKQEKATTVTKPGVLAGTENSRSTAGWTALQQQDILRKVNMFSTGYSLKMNKPQLKLVIGLAQSVCRKRMHDGNQKTKNRENILIIIQRSE